MMTTAMYHRVEDFLLNDDFIRYTLDCDSEKSTHWAQYLNASGQVRAAFLQATDILLHLDDTTLITREEADRLKHRIRHSLRIGVGN